jgi:PBP1b-binding outer membrane lipoprotein LpoB
MKKIHALAIVLGTSLFLAACSQDEPVVTDQVAEEVDRINTKNADTMVKKIKTPIDKARYTQNLGDERTRAIDEAMQNQ